MRKFAPAILGVACSLVSLASTAAEHPNVIFILADDLGYADVSCYGAAKVKTPHIDRLAATGYRFTDFHTAASICSPSRAAFLTGAYPQRCGLYMGINPQRPAQRGKAQRPTGSLFTEIPVISHPKDWGNLDAATSKKIERERQKRYPGTGTKKGRKKR